LDELKEMQHAEGSPAKRNLCNFSVFVRGSASRHSTASGYSYGATVAFTKSRSAFIIASSPERGARSTTKALTDLAALFVGMADDGAFGHGLMPQQHVFYLPPRPPATGTSAGSYYQPESSP